MGLQMGSVDHEPLGLPGLAGEVCEDPVEHAHPTPADKPVVDRLVWTIVPWRIRQRSHS